MMDSEEYRLALKAVIKKQMRSLVDQLRDTGEEIAILSANMGDNSCSHFGTTSGEWFVEEQKDLIYNFLKFCQMRTGMKFSPTKTVSNQKHQPSTSSMSLRTKALNKKEQSGEEGYDTTLNVKIPDHLTGAVSQQEVAGLVGRLVALTASNGSTDKLRKMLNIMSSRNSSGQGISPNYKSISPTRRSGRRITKTYKDSFYDIKSPSSKSVYEEAYIYDQLIAIDTRILKRLHVTTTDGRNVNIQTSTLTSEICNTIAGPIIQELLDYNCSSSLDFGQTLRNSKHIHVSVGTLQESVDGTNNQVSIEMSTQNTPESRTQNTPELRTQTTSKTMPWNGESVNSISSPIKKALPIIEKFEHQESEIDEFDEEDFMETVDSEDNQDTGQSFVDKDDSDTEFKLEEKRIKREHTAMMLSKRRGVAHPAPSEPKLVSSRIIPGISERKGPKRKPKKKRLTEDVTCPTCGLVIKGKYNLRNHIRHIHLRILEHQCAICKKKFASNKAREEHVLSVHTRRCGSCNSYVEESVPWDDGMHMGIERQLLCTCGATVYIWSKRGRKRNIPEEEIRKLEPLRKKPTPTPPGTKFACGTCGKLFLRRDLCLKHSRMHQVLKSFTCELCGLSYQLEASLRKHMKNIHNEIMEVRTPQFACSICNEKFPSQDILKTHKFEVHVDAGISQPKAVSFQAKTTASPATQSDVIIMQLEELESNIGEDNQNKVQLFKIETGEVEIEAEQPSIEAGHYQEMAVPSEDVEHYEEELVSQDTQPHQLVLSNDVDNVTTAQVISILKSGQYVTSIVTE